MARFTLFKNYRCRCNQGLQTTLHNQPPGRQVGYISLGDTAAGCNAATGGCNVTPQYVCGSQGRHLLVIAGRTLTPGGHKHGQQ